MKLRNLLALALVLSAALCQTNSLFAEDAYYHVPFKELTLTSGVMPDYSAGSEFGRMPGSGAVEPYAVVDGDGEAYAGDSIQVEPFGGNSSIKEDMTLSVRAPKDKDVTGRLFVPTTNYSALILLTFKIPASTAKSAARAEFFKAKQAHYQSLLDRGLPGAAWFRHEKQEAIAAGGGKTNAPPEQFNFRRMQVSDPEDTYSLFSGGRAVSENLQLDRALLAVKPGEATIDITNLAGITVKAMDWKALIKGMQPETDPLAACVPTDQHAIFFPSFEAMTQLMDEADKNGTPLLQMFEPRAEDRDCRGRYQRQLCLALSEVSRLLGPQMVDSAAFTGSDPYLRTGTDIGVLFETKSPGALVTFIQARQAAAAQGQAEVKPVQGDIDGVTYTGVVSPDRSVSSYVATRDKVVFVSNSLQQLGRMLAAAKGNLPALVSQDEYTFFRSRYARGDKQETAFLILSDAAIRRWCSPKWRIAASRRTRAAAALAEQQAAHLDDLVKGTVTPGPIQSDLLSTDAGELYLTKRGVSSTVYGSIDFLTPIAELPLARVTAAEAASYNRWRDSYQQNWSQYFDPIAARFSVSSNRVSAEMTVMPLIARTEYAEIAGLSTGAAIADGAGDPHPGALAHLALAVNAESEPVKQAANFLGSISPALKANALGWLGQCVALYADEDPFWDRLQKAEKPEEFMDKEYTNLPVALYCEVKNPLGVTAFLTALRAFAEQSSPGMTTWMNEEYNGQAYVMIKAKSSDGEPGSMDNLAVYYAVTPRSLMVTLNEPLLKRALDRQAARSTAKEPLPGVLPWLGTNLCLQLNEHFFTALSAMLRDNDENSAQLLSWNNLPILNEWKRRFPTQDPVALHEAFWQTRLVCPGGGTYVWNEKWQTMESTVYGHPGEPKKGPPSLGPLVNVSNVNLGLSFENQGLSAKAVLVRAGEKP